MRAIEWAIFLCMALLEFTDAQPYQTSGVGAFLPRKPNSTGNFA